MPSGALARPGIGRTRRPFIHSGSVPLPVTLLRCALALPLAAVPRVWALGRRGTRRRLADEGQVDGVLLLLALLASFGALVMSGVAGTRMVAERQATARSVPVVARVRQCDVSVNRVGGRNGGRAHTLRCDVAYTAGRASLERTVKAGYPADRRPLDAWLDAHPPGSELALRYAVAEPGTLMGFSELVPAVTTTAGAAAQSALLFGAAACVLFVVSRLVARAAR